MVFRGSRWWYLLLPRKFEARERCKYLFVLGWPFVRGNLVIKVDLVLQNEGIQQSSVFLTGGHWLL
jgi:hypothetical protein